MLRNNESLDVLIEYFGIGASDSLLQSTGMALQTIGEGVVISVNVFLLTHDWSLLKRYMARKVVADGVYFEKLAFKPLSIGAETFIGAGAIILPGTTIGKYCIVGAGAVVKGNVPDYAIVVGNPATCIGDTRDEKFKLVVDNP